jgi:hypothetical protein
MKKQIKYSLITAVILSLGIIVYFPMQKMARAHVNKMTGVSDHPLLCTDCHLYMIKSGPIHSLFNKKYYSPINLVVSKDGSRLYVV